MYFKTHFQDTKIKITVCLIYMNYWGATQNTE